MSETIKRGSTRIRYEGLLDWKEMYTFIVNWLKSKKFDYHENRNVKKPGPYGYELEYEAHAEREESGYVRHDIDIKIHGYHLEDVEVIVEGEKRPKTRAGMFIIDLTPSVVLDWQDKWDKRLKKKARDFFHKYIIRGYVYEQIDGLHYEMYKLHTKIKEMLDLEHKYSAYH